MAKGTKYSQQFKGLIIFNSLKRMQLVSSWIIRATSQSHAENLGVSESALKNWMKATKEHKGEVSYPWFWKLCK